MKVSSDVGNKPDSLIVGQIMQSQGQTLPPSCSFQGSQNDSIPRERMSRFLEVSLEAVELGVEVVEPGRDVA